MRGYVSNPVRLYLWVNRLVEIELINDFVRYQTVKGDFCIQLLCLDWKHSFSNSRKREKCTGQICAHISEK